MRKRDDWELIHYLENFEVKELAHEIHLKEIFFNEQNSKNHLLICALIDCLSDNSVISCEIEDFLVSRVSLKAHYLVKLSALDFFLAQETLTNGWGEPILAMRKVLVTRNFKIVVNQVLMNLAFLTKERDYVLVLFKNLEATDDYRSHIRVYNALAAYDFPQIFTSTDLTRLKEITKKKKFGRAVQKVLDRID
jgi:hypothetical protein